jgi:hypothetical protein
VWSLVQVDIGNTSSSYCIDVWTANVMAQSMSDANATHIPSTADYITHSAYNLYQITITFWLPFIALFVCYALISTSVYHVYNEFDCVSDAHLSAVYSQNIPSKSSKCKCVVVERRLRIVFTATKCTKSTTATTSCDALRLVSGQRRMRSAKVCYHIN